MNISDIFLYPAKVLLHFVLSLFHIQTIPYGWEVVLTGLVAFWLWSTLLKGCVAVIKRVCGFA